MTTRIAYITDLHVGGRPEGDWHPQPFNPDKLPAIFNALRAWLDREQVEVLIVGGDLVEAADQSRIETGIRSLATLERTVVMTLGNHDLVTPEKDDRAMTLWRHALCERDWLHIDDTHLALPGIDVLSLNNHWLDKDDQPKLVWIPGGINRPAVTDAQFDWLDGKLAEHDDRPALLAIHAPLRGVPARLNAERATIDVPVTSYTQPLSALLDRHPRLRLVLSGHSHVCFTQHIGNRIESSTAAFTESPCDVRLIDVAPGSITVRTDALHPPGIRPMDQSRAWVGGDDGDRAFELA